MVTKGRHAPTIIEAKLTDEEKKAFSIAKDEALQVFIEHDGWERVPADGVDQESCCPMRFLLKWKMKNGHRVANARVLYLGF